MRSALIVLYCFLSIAVLVLLPWLLIWLSYWWPRIRYAHAAEENLEAKVVQMHDAMPYLHNRFGMQVEPTLPCSMYYVTFKAEGRAPMKFRISREDYYRIRQGDWGTLTFRGRLFVRFDVQNTENEAIFKDSN